MNNKNLERVIQQIAEIQITSLKRVHENPLLYDIEGLLGNLIKEDLDLFKEITQRRIRYWQHIQSKPLLIKNISHHQLGICTHILYVMEDTWLLENPEGVVDCWELFDSLYTAKHPEVKLLNLDVWKLKS